MAKRKGGAGRFSLNLNGLAEYAEKLEKAGVDIQPVMEGALNEAAKTITADTIAALAPANLPAGGKYSQGRTMESVLTDGQVTWMGSIAEVPVGFDFSKPGAGGLLITGTPKMRPDDALNKIYRQKRYMANIQKMMAERFNMRFMQLIEK